MSKGSKQRPSQIPEEQLANNWDRIFGKKDELLEKPINQLTQEEIEFIENGCGVKG